MVANSVRIGATSSDEKNATAAAYTTRATRPIGAVRGSVIMKNRKMRISGDVTRTDQNSHPLTEPTCQRAVIACPLSTTMPIPTANVTQNVSASASMCSRATITRPPTTMTVYVSARPTDI